MNYRTRSEATADMFQAVTSKCLQSLRSWFCKLLVLPLLMALAFWPISAVSNVEPIRIGVFLSLTGATSSYGESSLNSFRLATEEVNKNGGINGRQVELVVEDDHSNTGEVTGLVTKLINDRVHALLAEPVSTRAMVAAPIAQTNKVVMISPASIKPEVTLHGDYIFRACFTSPVEGEALAKFAATNLKARRGAIILDGKNDYAVVLAGFIAEYFKKHGGEIVMQQYYEAADKDVTHQMASIKATQPDVIFAPGFYTTAGMVVRDFKLQRISATLLGSDGWDSPELLRGGSADFEGVYFAGHFWVGSKLPIVQKFVSDYTKKYGTAPDALAATSYDAARMLFEAIRTAKSTESSAIRDALARTAKFAGVTGELTLDKNRNANAPVYMIRIDKGGKFSLQS